MEKIVTFELNHFSMKTETRIAYKSIDELVFPTEAMCTRHEANIRTHISFYEEAVKSGIFTVSKLQEIYNDYKKHESSWRRDLQQYPNYCAGQYALQNVIRRYRQEVVA